MMQRKDDKVITLNENGREIWSHCHRRTIHHAVGHLSAHGPKLTLIRFCQVCMYVSH